MVVGMVQKNKRGNFLSEARVSTPTISDRSPRRSKTAPRLSILEIVSCIRKGWAIMWKNGPQKNSYLRYCMSLRLYRRSVWFVACFTLWLILG